MIYLLLATFFWGSTFIVQRTASSHIDAFLFNGTRFGIAGILFLLICILKKIPQKKQTISDASFSGLLIMLAINLQQMGVERTSAGKAGIITSLYILFVPCILRMYGRKITFRETTCLCLSLFGFFMLSDHIDLYVQLGDILVLISAFIFAIQVYFVGEKASAHNTLLFATYQYLSCGLLSMLCTPFITTDFTNAIIKSRFEIAYACIFSVIFGYTFQILGQKKVPTVIASFIMSLEGPIAIILGMMILAEGYSKLQLLGAAIIAISCAIVSLESKNPLNTTS